MRLAWSTTYDYNVVMSVVSVRFSDASLRDRLKARAAAEGRSISVVAEQLIEEGLPEAAHPNIVFRDGPTGRRATLLAGPEIVDVIGAMVGGDVPIEDRRRRAAELLNVHPAMIDAAIAYYADYAEEVDEALADRARAADEEESAWRRQQELLAR